MRGRTLYLIEGGQTERPRCFIALLQRDDGEIVPLVKVVRRVEPHDEDVDAVVFIHVWNAINVSIFPLLLLEGVSVYRRSEGVGSRAHRTL